MNEHPIAFFNHWLTTPITVRERTPIEIIRALNSHPLSSDETAQEYIMPQERVTEFPGRFRIFGENQDAYYCFIYSGQEGTDDPPVYFETCLNLKSDHGFSETEIIDGNHVLVCSQFSNFLWHILGQYICLRVEKSRPLAPEVMGILFEEPIVLNASFVNPLGRRFPAGFTCFISEGVICIPDWGAAFLDEHRYRSFIEEYSPVIKDEWG